ncbi:hypothetical protein ACE6H2_026631 [Prunus campanulata]
MGRLRLQRWQQRWAAAYEHGVGLALHKSLLWRGLGCENEEASVSPSTGGMETNKGGKRTLHDGSDKKD